MAWQGNGEKKNIKIIASIINNESRPSNHSITNCSWNLFNPIAASICFPARPLSDTPVLQISFLPAAGQMITESLRPLSVDRSPQETPFLPVLGNYPSHSIKIFKPNIQFQQWLYIGGIKLILKLLYYYYCYGLLTWLPNLAYTTPITYWLV